MATVGQSLTTPEPGWKRYDNKEFGIAYTGTWSSGTASGNYADTYTWSNTAGSSVSFKFKGTKVRIIADSNSGADSSVRITIDGVVANYSQQSPSTLLQVLVFEQQGLSNDIHQVVIERQTGPFSLDAIDIDNTGYLVGQQLTTPEPGWVRVEETSSSFKFDTGWNTDTYALNSGGSQRYVTNGTHWIKFTFYGTKFRFIGNTNYDRAVGNVNTVLVDGVSRGGFSQYSASATYRVLNYEIDNLPLGLHTVQITTSGVVGFDAIDIDADGYFATTKVGEVLTAPEHGWRRHDDASPTISYTGSGWGYVANDVNLYLNTGHYITAPTTNSIKFKFYGSRIRLIDLHWTNRVGNVNVKIDGITYSYSPNNSTNLYKLIVFEKLDLSLAVHDVVISTDSTSNIFSIDAIDIDATGRLLHTDEVTDINDLVVGKRIRCSYMTLTSGAVGTFSSLGQEVSAFIPTTGSATPNGDFYYIMVDEYNGKKILVADRNLQNSVSWDTLNIEGISSGSGVPFYLSAISVPMTITTQNTSPIGVASASSTVNAETYRYQPWNAFDGLADDNGWVSANTAPAWLEFNFNTARVITRYGFAGRPTTGNACPKDFKFQAYDVVSNQWVDLDTQAGVASPAAGVYKYFNFQNETAYRRYRIYITANNGNTNYHAIGEMRMFEAQGRAGLTLRLLTGGVSAADKDNEWDKFIVNSTLNSTIAAGDNAVWNWSGMYSWTSTSRSSSERAVRGYGTTTGDASGATNSGAGFRPVLVIELPDTTIKFKGGLDKSSIDLDAVVLSGELSYPEVGATVTYRVLLNGTQVYPASGTTPSQPMPVQISYTLQAADLVFELNTVVLEATDPSGKVFRFTYTVTKTIANRYLIQDMGIKVYRDGQWVVVGQAADDSMFMSEGMRTLAGLPFMLLAPRKVRVLNWTNAPIAAPKSMNVSGSKRVPFQYKVELQEPPVTLIDWTAAVSDVSGEAVLPAENIKTINPYTVAFTAVELDGGYTATKNATVTLVDTEPHLVASMTGMRLDLAVGDADMDKVQFRVLLNGNQIYPEGSSTSFTDLVTPEVSYARVMRSNEIVVGAENTVTVIARDQFGKESTVTLPFTGEYSGLMFADEQGNFYSTDLGDVLQYLDLGVLMAGQVSQTYPVRLINRTGYPIENITLTRNTSLLPGGVYLEISQSESPFVPEGVIAYADIMDYNDEFTFYVRVVTTLSSDPGQGEFDVYVTGDPLGE